jgi:hypothetical protein
MAITKALVARPLAHDFRPAGCHSQLPHCIGRNVLVRAGGIASVQQTRKTGRATNSEHIS